MKLPLKEFIDPRYLYINPNTNIVHLLLPIMSDREIGSEKTSKSVYPLQEFFGYTGANEQKKALSELVRYQAALESDIRYLNVDSKLRKEKEARLSQIRMYFSILKPIQNNEQLEKLLHRAFPLDPTHFAEFMQTGFFKLNSEEREFLNQAQADFATVDKPHNQLPHYNEQVKADVELDLSKMDNDALQVLYEDINAYDNKETKDALFTQFQKERPDFKPQIDAKAFLQHVAYGQQDEAETLLKENPRRAQKLLKAHEIAFTDYSGRTFACTAYEYAYWAKDAHMMRMLEQYIRKDEDTRQFILNRVLDIEKPENPKASPDFFPNPNAPLKKNKGLNYITQNEKGEVIHANETHFSLQPLIKALENYLKHWPKGTWMMLDNLWVKEVGQAQRQVPAHIAQEYCHPNRSFYDVRNYDVRKNVFRTSFDAGSGKFIRIYRSLLDASHPGNLIRQLNFYNHNTKNSDLWFTPYSHSSNSGLGFSIAILRSGTPSANGDNPRWSPGDDLDAIKAIDEMRTNDLKQSIDNLRSPLVAQAAQLPRF
jgi:hypothetical protein